MAMTGWPCALGMRGSLEPGYSMERVRDRLIGLPVLLAGGGWGGYKAREHKGICYDTR